MDLTVFQLSLFLSATFAAALVAGVTGFAFALIAAAVWLHILTPLQTATLTICYGLIVQGYGFWKMRHAFNWERSGRTSSAARPASRSASRCCDGPIPPTCAWASRRFWCCIRSTASRGLRSSRSRPAPPPTSSSDFSAACSARWRAFPASSS